ncbi:monocarboxylate transporter 12 [Plakobranchus ocellatus]|uniref:Monocarboxylate transporter 12 n=1 Tax=Plakobranchus ocellatus TaxID=259542 RepID=A0AAV4CMG7_9GAST|nr:monocarboxylate transporter 12 [Plakobranchus ocellatus]
MPPSKQRASKQRKSGKASFRPKIAIMTTKHLAPRLPEMESPSGTSPCRVTASPITACFPCGVCGNTTFYFKLSSTQVSIESLEDYIPTPPDGGWGWVVVGASMLGNFIVDGIGYGFGVFLMPLVKAFNAPKSQVSLVGSLLPGTYLFAGAVVSAMTNKFGCRPVVIAGTLVSTMAFILASQSTTITMLILTYGVMGGFGLGMMYLPCIVIVGYYFERRRGLANGLAVSGSGMGTFAFSPLAEYLLSEYNWQGALLIIAGLIFNGCICGILMRPLEAKPKPKSARKPPREKNLLDRLKESTQAKNRSVSECSPGQIAGSSSRIQEGVLEAKRQRENRLQDTDSNLGSLPSTKIFELYDVYPSSEPQRQKQLSISSANDSVVSATREATRVGAGSGEPAMPTVTVYTDGSKVKDIQDPGNEAKVSDTAGGANDDTSIEKSDFFTPPTSPASSNHSSPKKEIDVGLQQSGNDLVKKMDTAENRGKFSETSRNNNNINGTIHSIPSISSTSPTVPSLSTPVKSTTHTTPGIETSPLLEVPDPSIAIGHKKGVGDYKRNTSLTSSSGGNRAGSRTNMSHLSSLRSLHVSKKDLARPLYRKDIFYSGSVLNIPQYHSEADMKSYITSITTFPGASEFVDSPKSSKCINKCCGFLPRSARDVLGVMVDISLLKDLSFMLICIGNIFTFLGFFIPFMFLVDRASELGVGQKDAAFLVSIIGELVCPGDGAGFVSLSSIIICDRMGLEKLTNGFGLLCLVRGVGTMMGPPLAGAMYDSSGSYDLSFFLGGLLMAAGASCHVLLHLPCLSRRKPYQEELVLEAVEEITDNEHHNLAGMMGSKPQIITLEDALSSV